MGSGYVRHTVLPDITLADKVYGGFHSGDIERFGYLESQVRSGLSLYVF